MKRIKLTVGFDAKRAVQNNTGLGNYSRLVIGTMAAMYPQDRYVLLAPRMRENPRLDPILMRDNVEVFTPTGAVTRRLKSWWRSVEMVHDWAGLGLDLYHGLSNEIPLTSSLSPVPTVVTIHDLIWRRIPQDYSAIDRRLYEFKYKRSARIATRIIAISERTKSDMVNDWGISPEKIDVVYQGCDPIFGKYISPDDKERIRSLYRLPRRYIISVGTVQSRKNQMLAVRGLARLPQDVSLVIVGGCDPSYKASLTAEIEKLRLGDRVMWLEGIPFDHLPTLYAMAELSSYTSRYEGFGIPVIESINCGTPVVACTGSCLEEAGGAGGIYVDPDDVDAFTEAAAGILDKRYLHDRLVDEGKRYVKRFNPSDFASSILKTYNKAILDKLATSK